MKLVFLQLLILVCVVIPAQAGKRVALVIGNSNYKNVTVLKNPENDAAVMAEALRNSGFEVVRFTNLDQRSMKQAMLEFGRKLDESVEASVFYYAGHGIEVNGLNYLVPTDADVQKKEEADIQNIGLNSLLSLMDDSRVPLKIVILDACRNNPFRSVRSIGGGLAPVVAPSGTYIAYATAPGSVAEDGPGANSAFTKALAESIGERGLSLESVFKRARARVQAATNGEQVPFDSSSIVGEFFFSSAEFSLSKAPPIQKEHHPKIGDGLWIEKGSSCKDALSQVNYDGEHIGISDGSIRKFGIRKGRFFDIETECDIVSLDQIGEDLVSDLKCFGEGEERQETRRFTLLSPKELILDKGLTFTLCKF